jgi:prolyl-tRNA synthetase
MFKRILSVLVLSLMMNTAHAGAAGGGASFDFAAALAVEGATIDSVVADALAANVDLADIIASMSDAGHSAETITFALVTAGQDSAAVVNAVANTTGADPTSLAETVITANANLRVDTGNTGDTGDTGDTGTTTAGSGSPLTTEQFITQTQEANS